MGTNSALVDEEQKEEEDKEATAAAERFGLVWDPEEGPVWGIMGEQEEGKRDDTWSQLLREGVSGITTDSDGEDKNQVCVSFGMDVACWSA